MYLDAIKTGKKRVPEPPDWLPVILLARRMNKLPSDIDDEPMEWVARLLEYFYQTDKQGIDPHGNLS